MPEFIVQQDYIATGLQGGRLASVWVAGINRYGWPACVGILMQAMVGFRNVAVHDYRKLSMVILRSILDERLGDFRQFSRQLIAWASGNSGKTCDA